MKKIADSVLRWYTRLVLDHPVFVIVVLALVIAGLGYQARRFRIDASAETLLLENDKDLRYTREMTKRYGAQDILLIAYTPKDGPLLSDANLEAIGRLRDELAKLPRVSSVLTLLDVPLFQSPPLSYAEVSEGIRTLASPETDRGLANVELRESPFYRDLIVSRDMQTTALLVSLKSDDRYLSLLQQRNQLYDRRMNGPLDPAAADTLRRVETAIDRRMAVLSDHQQESVAAVRRIMDGYRTQADLFLGGATMVQNDMIAFIRNDLKMFGLGVFVLLVVMLGIIFQRVLWVVLPMLCCFVSVVAMMGTLALFDWEVTVISSNFISLQLIITLAIVVHLIVRYREFHRSDPQKDQRTLVHDTVRTKFVPCLYAALTTIAGFSSLVFCDIKPVIQFGWMMCAGLVVSLFLTFILFPATVILAGRRELPA
ncbi:MAG: MMPL family transporter, partial [Desulfatitalea sp.]|nr:MMPL family transporter [Desulfatitalea sp.]